MTEPTARAFADPVDEVTPATLKELTQLSDPCVTLLMPTRRDNTENRHDALLLRSLAQDAGRQLSDRGLDPQAYLSKIYDLVDDTLFWANQGDGLAIYADEQTHHVFRLPRTVAQLAHVGAAPRLVPLTRVASGDESFYVLALGQNQVRLFEGHRDSLRQVDLGPIPASMDDMERQATREPELQHQHQPAGRGAATFHGHGGVDTQEIAMQKFITEVANGARTRLGADNQRPVVLAAVAEHLPALQATGQLPTLLDEAVTGNPENLRPDELLDRAWPVVRARLDKRRQELGERFGAGHGTGTAVSDAAELHRAAAEGRIETILVAPETNGDRPDEHDDVAVVAALRTGATLSLAHLPDGVPLGALVRY